MASTDSMSLLVVLNLTFAVIALAVGFVAGVWLTGKRRAAHETGLDEEVELQKQLERERAALATERLRDLAGNVASDVGEHNKSMGEITAGLQSLDVTDVEATGAGLVDALSKIVTANEVLQERLAKAEEQIAAQAREIHLHESEARTDSLTGLANRRAFDDEMRRRHSEASRKGTVFSMLILDIDFFKKFNDTHGHQAGDEVLRAVGRQLVKTCGDMDLPCRYGGEEFAVVMPATSAKDAKTAAERIRADLESLTVVYEGKQLQITTSIGLAQWNTSEDVFHLLKRADDALYASKKAGRNCCHWNEAGENIPFTPRLLKNDEPTKKVKKANSLLIDTLPSRTKFADEIRRRMAESARTGRPISLVVFEPNSYEYIAKTHGLDVARATLDVIAVGVQNTIREMDLLARLDDSRLIVMLPENDSETASSVALRINLALNQCRQQLGDEVPEFEVEYGVSELEAGDTVESLVGRAVDDLAKQSEPDKVLQYQFDAE
ncbi:diguanylate cyclase domain-containing protein [Aeoliella mucimassa]|uniref:diguanylate cyclase n=1 Tax=Aeoliella mucimassa TaxID=2527972 RepID=A0A518ALA3_9BACT|nr:diguanylate cyclase [Aeoliella mucimassa]QDU55518.1 Response regulator PleD [Aeoliella mucimassa]